jgi:hypothetical protein
MQALQCRKLDLAQHVGVFVDVVVVIAVGIIAAVQDQADQVDGRLRVDWQELDGEFHILVALFVHI